jgi:E3 ubiquitin-protein ligase NEDD4
MLIPCRDNDITDVLDETFTVEDERFGEMLTLELVPGGANIALTEENKQQWVKYVSSIAL